MTRALLVLLVLAGMKVNIAYGGNPDRQGEAGAYELLMNPWARSAGLHSMSTSMVRGVESIRLNVAGLARIQQMEVNIGYANYLQGTGIAMNAFGLASKTGQKGALGFSVMTLDFGDIPVTTTDQPEGTGSTFSPRFMNIGLSYAHTFENKVSVGVTLRGISQAISNVTALGFAIDAGVQYVSGLQDNFKFGISLRNVGPAMKYTGEGLSVARPSPNGFGYDLTFDQRAAGFELPSTLNIGMSYDFLVPGHRLTILGNFASHSFSQDQLGAGFEYGLSELFFLRGGYRYEFGSQNKIEQPIYTGLSAGFGFEVPFSRKENGPKLGIDYAFRQTKIWGGTHNLGLRLSI
jgi:hypothetical protein